MHACFFLSLVDMNKEELTVRVDHLIAKGRAALATTHDTKSNSGVVNPDLYIGFRSACLSFIARLFSNDHPYFGEFEATLSPGITYASRINCGIQILQSIKHEIEEGWLTSLRQLVTADIFSDFLEMAEHLLKQDYKDAAAVIAGSVLEDSLRKLAISNGIAIANDKGKPLTIEPINVELARKEVYNQLEKKQVTSWAELRNNAAHGHYDEYDTMKVKDMIDYVTRFASTYLV